MQAIGLTLLGHLTYSDSSRSDLVQHGVFDSIAAALDAHPRSKQVVKAATLVLLKLTVDSALRAQVMSEDEASRWCLRLEDSNQKLMLGLRLRLKPRMKARLRLRLRWMWMWMRMRRWRWSLASQ